MGLTKGFNYRFVSDELLDPWSRGSTATPSVDEGNRGGTELPGRFRTDLAERFKRECRGWSGGGRLRVIKYFDQSVVRFGLRVF
jgi:hypothetical protein